MKSGVQYNDLLPSNIAETLQIAWNILFLINIFLILKVQ